MTLCGCLWQWGYSGMFYFKDLLTLMLQVHFHEAVAQQLNHLNSAMLRSSEDELLHN